MIYVELSCSFADVVFFLSKERMATVQNLQEGITSSPPFKVHKAQLSSRRCLSTFESVKTESVRVDRLSHNCYQHLTK